MTKAMLKRPYCHTCVRWASFHPFVCPFICSFVHVPASTEASTLLFTLNEGYKLYKSLLLVSLHWLFYLTELTKDDSFHSSGVCFHIFSRQVRHKLPTKCFIYFLCVYLQVQAMKLQEQKARQQQMLGKGRLIIYVLVYSFYTNYNMLEMSGLVYHGNRTVV